MSAIDIRDAQQRDVPEIAAIYNHYVLHSTVTFDTEPKTDEDRAVWLEAHSESHPVLVAVGEGRVLGWGSLSPWHERPAYERSVEVSTYIAPDAIGQGIGSALMESLIDRATQLGHHALISQIVAGNAPSLALGERFGYSLVGTLPQVGRKFDRWLDVVLMIRLLPTDEDRRC